MIEDILRKKAPPLNLPKPKKKDFKKGIRIIKRILKLEEEYFKKNPDAPRYYP